MQHAFCEQIVQAGGATCLSSKPISRACLKIAYLFAEPKACAGITFAQQNDQHSRSCE